MRCLCLICSLILPTLAVLLLDLLFDGNNSNGFKYFSKESWTPLRLIAALPFMRATEISCVKAVVKRCFSTCELTMVRGEKRASSPILRMCMIKCTPKEPKASRHRAEKEAPAASALALYLESLRFVATSRIAPGRLAYFKYDCAIGLRMVTSVYERPLLKNCTPSGITRSFSDLS